MPRMKVFHDRNAPAASRVILTRMKNFYGEVPEIAGAMATSGHVLENCTAFADRYIHGTLDLTECHVVLLVAMHTVGNSYAFEIGANMVRGTDGVPDRIIRLISSGRSLRKKKLDTLRDFVVTVVQRTGQVDDNQFERIKKAGYTDEQIIEILMGISLADLWSNLSYVARLDDKADANA